MTVLSAKQMTLSALVVVLAGVGCRATLHGTCVSDRDCDSTETCFDSSLGTEARPWKTCQLRCSAAMGSTRLCPSGQICVPVGEYTAEGLCRTPET
jgi:hypothetical protein